MIFLSLRLQLWQENLQISTKTSDKNLEIQILQFFATKGQTRITGKIFGFDESMSLQANFLNRRA